MSDVPTEAFTLIALALFLWFWRRVWCGRFGLAAVLLPVVAGMAAGASLLSKFSGILGLATVAAWSGFTLLVPGVELSASS